MNENVKNEEVKEREYLRYSEIEKKEIEWLWYPYIPKGMVTIVQGDPKCGKTTMLIDIISRITNGYYKPLSIEKFDVGSVLLQNNDDQLSVLRERLDKKKTNIDKVILVDENESKLYFDDLNRLINTIEKERPCLLVFDPIQAFMGDTNINSQVEVRNSLKPLKDIAEKYNCAIVLVQHLKKGFETKAIYKGAGSIDFVGFARSTIMIMKEPSDKDERLLLHTSSNVAKEGHCLSYRLTDNGVEWLEDKGDIDADLLVNEGADTKLEYAKNFIIGCLSTNNKVAGSEWDNLMKVGGFKSRTFNSARSILSKNNIIESFKGEDRKTYWRLKNYKVQSCKVGSGVSNE